MSFIQPSTELGKYSKNVFIDVKQQKNERSKMVH